VRREGKGRKEKKVPLFRLSVILHLAAAGDAAGPICGLGRALEGGKE